MLKLLQSRRGVVRYVDGDLVVSSRGRTVYLSQDAGNSWSLCPALPLSAWGRIKAIHPLTRRLTRADLHHFQMLPSGQSVVLGFGRVYSHRPMSDWVERGRITGRRPLALSATPEGALYYGEYRDNAERSQVSVMVSEDVGTTWRAAWTFDDVRHVHGVFHDPYDDSLWVTTGDENAECGLWRTADRFRTLELVRGGTQEFRIVQPIFTHSAVLFGSDAPDQINWLQRMERDSRHVTKVQQVSGPVFYGTLSGAWAFFSTSVEPSVVNTSIEAEVWASRDDGQSWAKVLSFQKDCLPSRLFQYGQVLFPAGPGSRDRLWLTPFATRGDQVSLCYELPR